MAPYSHLHVHSCFSFHDGADTPAALVERAAALGYAALALTDTNGLYGAVPFCKAAKAAGIAPLLGAEINGGNPDGPRAVVLARGRAGYPALCRIVTRRHGEFVDDVIPALSSLRPGGNAPGGREVAGSALWNTDAGGVARRGGPPSARSLWRAPTGVRSVHPSGGVAGRTPKAIGTEAQTERTRGIPRLVDLVAAEAGSVVVLAADPGLLRALAPRLPAGTLFGELVYDGTDAAAARCRATLAACRRLGLPFVATNAVRFCAPGGFAAHRVLRAIGENGTVWSTKPRAAPQHFLKSREEMHALFAHLPEALGATARIAEQCACPIGFEGWKFPEAHVPKGETPFSVLWQKSFEGLKARYRPLSHEAVERLRYEIGIIDAKGFSPYFLVVDEIAAKARGWGLRTIGRGSAANSLVSHCLGLTHVDPLAHGLFFERFLNPERASPPDIDLDFSWKDRDRLLAWVYERFGHDRVAMISAHVTFGARAAVREAGKAHGLPDAELTRLTKRIPHWGAHDLENLAATVPECRSLPTDAPEIRAALALAKRLQGLPRHLSVHAGGIVIAPGPLTDLVPLERAAKGLVVTQYDMGPIEELGLVKIDLLSQRSLGVLQDAAAAVAAHTGVAPPVDERALVFADPATRALIREGRTMGCFYVESPAMRSLLRKLATETFEELTAASSVIRPGVAESGMMQEYIHRHHIAKNPGAAGPGVPALRVDSAFDPLAAGRSLAGANSACGLRHAPASPAGSAPVRPSGDPERSAPSPIRDPRPGSRSESLPVPERRGGAEGRSPAADRREHAGGPQRPPQRRGGRQNPAATHENGESWYLHPALEPVLRETHGVMIYQEDVLRVAHALAGMSLAEADLLRRSMSGKLRSPEAMARVREGFLQGCLANDVAPGVAAETWRQIESFAGYAFCKAHSASYALLSLQVAYLKAHHPAEFMAAVISNQGGFYGTPAYVSEARRMGLAVLLPDVNRSGRDWSGRGREIRIGLMAFTGLAEAAIAGLLAARDAGGPFTNLSDLLARGGLGRADLELLVRGGACDGFELTRPELLWRLACRFAGHAPSLAADGGRASGGSAGADLFPGAGGLDHLVPRLPEYGLAERCRMEQEIFGFMVTRHPLELLPCAGRAAGPPLVTAAAMPRHAGRRVRMRGLAISYKRIPTKGGAWMKFLSLEDLTGTFEAVLFPSAYARFAELTLGSGPFLLEGRVEIDHGVPALTVTGLAGD